MAYPSKKDLIAENEANIFACYLLMPVGVWEREVDRVNSSHRDEDKALLELQKVFQVPLFAIVMRFQLDAIEKKAIIGKTKE